MLSVQLVLIIFLFFFFSLQIVLVLLVLWHWDLSFSFACDHLSVKSSVRSITLARLKSKFHVKMLIQKTKVLFLLPLSRNSLMHIMGSNSKYNFINMFFIVGRLISGCCLINAEDIINDIPAVIWISIYTIFRFHTINYFYHLQKCLKCLPVLNMFILTKFKQ